MSKDDDALFEEAMVSLELPPAVEDLGSGGSLADALAGLTLEPEAGLNSRAGRDSALVLSQDVDSDEALFVRALADLDVTDEGADGPDSPSVRPQRYGSPRAVERMIRRGEMRADVTLDLHGLTEPLAWQAVVPFLANARSAGHEVALVICGRGLHSRDRAVLLEALESWLRGPLDAHIKASYPASTGPGSRGAWFLILR